MVHLGTYCRRLLVLSAVVAAGIQAAGAGFRADRLPGVPVEEPRGRGPGPVIVAVIDTGVDAAHPALKDRVLAGINVVKPGAATGDPIGHGTAVAGLICGRSASGEETGAAGGADVRILPVTIFRPGEDTADPALLAPAILKALDAGATVLCIALGAARCTRETEEAIATAQSRGALVIAAAGTGGAFDLFPAALPWVVSCTAASTLPARDGEGRIVMTEQLASFANASWKTDVLGTSRAEAPKAGGGWTTLQGTSVPCARAAGLAAWLRWKRPDLDAAQVRDILILSGASGSGAEEDLRLRFLNAEAVRRRESKIADLVIRDVRLVPPTPAPGTEATATLTVANLGDLKAAGKARFTAGEGEPAEAEFAEVPAGGSLTVDVRFRVPDAVGGTAASARAQIASPADVNPANDVATVRFKSGGSAPRPFARRVRLERRNAGEKAAVVRCEAVNPTDQPVTLQIAVRFGSRTFGPTLTLKPGEAAPVAIEAEFPANTDAWGSFPLLVWPILKRDGKEEVLDPAGKECRLEPDTLTPQSRRSPQ